MGVAMDGLALTLGSETAGLVRAAARGDRNAFDRLVQLHAKQVYRVALRMLGNADDAEDVQQETFLQAYRRLSGFRCEAAFGTWLYTIVARLCLSRQRRRAIRPEEVPAEVAPIAGPEEQFAAREEAARVQGALAAMSPPDRLLIVLRYVEQLSHAEIGQVLQCSPESSRSRLSRARRLFRERYLGREQ
jgi:RNA polymerase sigma-70 factor (ECF subfamily)